MALPVPNLDDRTFQDLVNEARRRIPVYCPEWTDHNLSDPGITLIELFSWMTELIIYRLNRVPDKNYVKFLELLGVSLKPANPASTNITFMLTAPRATDLIIPAGTEVATVRTETEEAIVFTTNTDLTIRPAQLEYFLVSGDGSRYDDRRPLLLEWEQMLEGGQPPTTAAERMMFPLFQAIPHPGNSFYLGYSSDLRNTVLSINLACVEAAGTGINPANPPLLWEYWDAVQMAWVPFERLRHATAWLQSDGTRGLNTRGQVILHVPGTAGRRNIDACDGYWIRCSVTESSEWQGSLRRHAPVKAGRLGKHRWHRGRQQLSLGRRRNSGVQHRKTGAGLPGCPATDASPGARRNCGSGKRRQFWLGALAGGPGFFPVHL